MKLKERLQLTIPVLLATIFPRSVLGVLGRVFGALSLLALLQHSLEFGLSITFEIVLDIYLTALRATIGLLDPLLIWVIETIPTLLSIELRFDEGWRHIFVILQILFVRDAGTAFANHRVSLGITRLLVGTAVSVLTAAFTFLTYTDTALYANIIFCLIPLLGLLVYDLVMYVLMATIFFYQIGEGEVEKDVSRTIFFGIGVYRSFIRFALVGAASCSLFLFPYFQSLAYPHGGLLAINIGLIANAAYWIYSASMYAAQQSRSGQKFTAVFLVSEAGQFGMAVLGIIFWFGFFCITNAGMRLLGF